MFTRFFCVVFSNVLSFAEDAVTFKWQHAFITIGNWNLHRLRVIVRHSTSIDSNCSSSIFQPIQRFLLIIQDSYFTSFTITLFFMNNWLFFFQRHIHILLRVNNGAFYWQLLHSGGGQRRACRVPLDSTAKDAWRR